MRKIEEVFQKLRKKGDGALIAYVTGGDPDPKWTPKIVEELIHNGADLVELGIPFSDPIADGPTIQAASTRALESGVTPRDVLHIAREIRQRFSTPLVILTYYNPIFRMGVEKFFKLAEESGINGIVVPDLPIEEAEEYKKTAEAHSIDTIFLAAPSTSSNRIQRIIKYSSGFLYLVALYGTTGARKDLQDSTVQLIRRLLPYTKGQINLAVGFGISRPSHVKTVLESGADGVIVGSAFVKVIEENLDNQQQMLHKLGKLTKELKKATLKP
jgi:tryptophan synthase alpha chain